MLKINSRSLALLFAVVLAGCLSKHRNDGIAEEALLAAAYPGAPTPTCETADYCFNIVQGQAGAFPSELQTQTLMNPGLETVYGGVVDPHNMVTASLGGVPLPTDPAGTHQLFRFSANTLTLELDFSESVNQLGPGGYEVLVVYRDVESGPSVIAEFFTLYIQVEPAPVHSGGWTDLTPTLNGPQESQIVYVSNSGNDATCICHSASSLGASSRHLEPGFDEKACATHKRAYELCIRHGKPDHLYFKKGDLWNTALATPDANAQAGGIRGWRKSGYSPTQPIVISSYNKGDFAGPRPRFQVPNSRSAFTLENPEQGIHSFITIAHLGFYHSGRAFNSSNSGFALYTPSTHIRLEGNYYSKFGQNILLNPIVAPSSNIFVHRNIVEFGYSTNGHGQGIFATAVDGPFEITENVFDHNGYPNEGHFDEHGSTFNHNIYTQRSARITRLFGNWITRGAATGVQGRGGGTWDNNYLAENAVGLQFGSWWNAASTTGTITNNVIQHSKDYPRTPEGEPNPPHGGYAKGWGLSMTLIDSGLIENNVISHHASQNPNAHGIRMNGGNVGNGINNVIVRGNKIHNHNRGLYTEQGSEKFENIRYENNDVQVTYNAMRLVKHSISSAAQAFIVTGNQWYALYDDQKYFVSGGARVLLSWLAQTDTHAALNLPAGDAAGNISRSSPIPFCDPSRTAARYHASLGGSESLDAIISVMKSKSEDYWPVAYEVPTINNWIRAGFELCGS